MRRLAARSLLALCAGAWAASAGAQQPPARFGQARISAEEWAAYRAEVVSRPDARVHEREEGTVIQIAAERAVYVFTVPGHPAHPAVVRRSAFERNGRLLTATRGHFAGARDPFLAWFAGFEESDEEVRRRAGASP